ncbi:MAG: hypothetical protein ACP5D2_02660 [Candidatus Nanoarchaeia archaeon]
MDISLVERVFIHSVDLPEALIKCFKNKPESLSYIYKKHEIRYMRMLNKVNQYDGKVPRRLKESILKCAQTCTFIRYYVACSRIRIEKHTNSYLCYPKISS